MSDNIFQQPQPQAKLETVAAQTGLEVPVESVALPSQGLIYPLGHPLCNEQTLDIKCMTAREEDIMTSRALFKNGTVLTKLIQACVLNKALDPDELLIGDRNAVLIAIRVTGYGPDYSVKLSCDSCGEEYDETFSLGALKVKPIGAKPLAENTNAFSFTLPLSGKEVHFKLLNGKDEDEISKTIERKKKLGNQVDNTMTLRLFQAILSVGGETDRGKILNIVNNLRAADSRALRKYIADISPSVDMKQKSTCKACGEEQEVDVPLGLNFFWPDLSV